MKKKIQWVINFDQGDNPLSMQNYEQFVKDTGFGKLKLIARDYEASYSKEFSEWANAHTSSPKALTEELIIKFIDVLRKNLQGLVRDNLEQELKRYTNQILLLDFMITLYHLVVMQKNFSKK